MEKKLENYKSQDKTNQQKISFEIPKEEWETLFILQRHGKYDNRWPKKGIGRATDDEQKTLGRLTEQGKKDLRGKTKERLVEIFRGDIDNIDFLLLNSPTFWLDDESLGKRARESAEIVAEEIKNFLKRYNIKNSKILNEIKRENNTPAFKHGISREDERIQEAQFFQNPEFVDFLKKHSDGDEDFWLNFYKDKFQEKRKDLGVEGPDDIVKRVDKLLKVLVRFAKMYHKKHQNRKLLFWIITHGDDIDSFVHKKMKIDAENYSSGYDDFIAISK